MKLPGPAAGRGGLAGLAFALSALLAGPAAALAAEDASGGEGKRLYRTHCATCHGLAGKGDGPMADRLRYASPDLTRLAHRNRGQYPADAVRSTIDGRKPAKGHGRTDMPIWGDAFKTKDAGYSEKAVKERIKALLDFLESIQE